MTTSPLNRGVVFSFVYKRFVRNKVKSTDCFSFPPLIILVNGYILNSDKSSNNSLKLVRLCIQDLTDFAQQVSYTLCRFTNDILLCDFKFLPLHHTSRTF